MKKKVHVIEIIIRIFSSAFKVTPVKSVFSLLYYVINGIYPAFNVIILKSFFDIAYNISNGVIKSSSQLVLYASIFIGMLVFKTLLEFIYASTVRIGIFEQCSDYYDIQLSKKTSELDLICFEDSTVYNDYKLARDCVNGLVLPNTYISICNFIISIINIVLLVFTLSSFSPWFILLSAISVLPYLITRIIRGKEFYKLKEKQAAETRKMNYYWSLFTQRHSAKEMRVMGFSDFIMQKWVKVRNEVNHELWNFESKDIKVMSLCDVIRIFAYGICIVSSIILSLHGLISVGVIGACLAAFSSIQSAFSSFLIEAGKMPEQLAFSNNYYHFLNYQPHEKGDIPFRKLNQNINMNSVSFQYPNSDYKAVNNITCQINKGEIVAIVGENGSGKSTLAKLLLGLYTPEGQQIFFDDQSLDTIKKETFYENISLVSQNYVAYNLTLRENIGISDVSRIEDDATIRKAMASMNVDFLIDKLGGLNTEMGREFGGEELSGGEWQKISIARALFKKFDFIVMDEPTSALDPLIEHEILSSFIHMAKGKTAIIVSHRVGLCKFVDKIVVMKKGQIVGIGTHKELLDNNEEYQRLYRAQEKWYVN